MPTKRFRKLTVLAVITALSQRENRIHNPRGHFISGDDKQDLNNSRTHIRQQFVGIQLSP